MQIMDFVSGDENCKCFALANKHCAPLKLPVF